MANISAYAEAAMLNWILLGATPTRPGTNAVGLSLGNPSSISGSEMTTGVGYTRQTVGFNSVATAGFATNTNAMTFGPFSSAYSITGLQIWDTILTLNSGSMLWYGTLATARTMAIGDSLVIASGQLSCTLG